MYKVITSFTTSNYSDAELLVKASDVIKGVTNNSNFPTPSPALDEVEAARVAYRDALAAANGGSHEAVAEKNEKRKALEVLMHDLAVYVNQTGKGDEKILLSSGFDLSKKAEPAGPLDAPENVQVHPAKSKGSVEVSCNRVSHASSYSVEYRNLTTPNGTATAFATKPKVLITGLTSGNQYAFRVLAVGTDPQRNWSDEVNSFVL
ncbi:fibronectin type III domain-containing protein [Mangrovibacterium marinum]|uniref:fibronectin type III domain-containing protein n=1 Tax=Mangrovibacterium marinum TaxID=1639118 RepID=UPI002A1888AB|nr:fibronectin type III domain-containing protein [Mangrovibacterium marinum]